MRIWCRSAEKIRQLKAVSKKKKNKTFSSRYGKNINSNCHISQLYKYIIVQSQSNNIIRRIMFYNIGIEV